MYKGREEWKRSKKLELVVKEGERMVCLSPGCCVRACAASWFCTPTQHAHVPGPGGPAVADAHCSPAMRVDQHACGEPVQHHLGPGRPAAGPGRGRDNPAVGTEDECCRRIRSRTYSRTGLANGQKTTVFLQASAVRGDCLRTVQATCSATLVGLS